MNSLVSIGLLMAILTPVLAEASEDAHNAAFCADMGAQRRRGTIMIIRQVAAMCAWIVRQRIPSMRAD